ncbi:uncharacterized protein LOC111083649 isoform X2 [Limulus polyphemus]|uniref:Uncharacterized protein LOC111083649 isoform X2 n=1 Tax=Limulus polyphemus TaxID=6850 RepID=A0ABM1RX96_LIMPO|nr:uncharacterized protein LOC111083649 isoform X2 [Limulus polyphemus]
MLSSAELLPKISINDCGIAENVIITDPGTSCEQDLADTVMATVTSSPESAPLASKDLTFSKRLYSKSKDTTTTTATTHAQQHVTDTTTTTATTHAQQHVTDTTTTTATTHAQQHVTLLKMTNTRPTDRTVAMVTTSPESPTSTAHRDRGLKKTLENITTVASSGKDKLWDEQKNSDSFYCHEPPKRDIRKYGVETMSVSPDSSLLTECGHISRVYSLQQNDHLSSCLSQTYEQRTKRPRNLKPQSTNSGTKRSDKISKSQDNLYVEQTYSSDSHNSGLHQPSCSQEATIYEEDMPVIMRRRGLMMRVRIVSVDFDTHSDTNHLSQPQSSHRNHVSILSRLSQSSLQNYVSMLSRLP